MIEMANPLKNQVEMEYGVDVDGDGVIGKNEDAEENAYTLHRYQLRTSLKNEIERDVHQDLDR